MLSGPSRRSHSRTRVVRVRLPASLIFMRLYAIITHRSLNNLIGLFVTGGFTGYL